MRHARQAFETRHRQAVLVVRSGRIRVAGIARNDRVCRGPPTIRAPGVKTASGIDRRRDPPRPAITSRLAAPTRRPIMFRPRHDLQAFPSSVGSARKEEGQNPSAVNQIGTRPPGRWGNARRCTAPPAAVKTSNPRLSPRDRSRRRWQPGSGRESWPQGQLTFECTPIAGVCVRGPNLKLCSDSSAGAGIGRLVATGRAHLPPSLPAGESSSETATRGDRKSRIGISAHSQLSPSPACRAPPRRSEQSPSPPAARSYQRIKSTSAGNCSSPTGEIEIAHDSSNATGGTRLGQAGDQPLAFAELHAGGIDFPAAVVCELELNGYAIERVYSHGRLVGVCLLEPQPPRHTRRTPAPPAPLVVQIAILRRPHDHRRWSRL